MIQVLITSNDSRIRLYDIRNKDIEQKYRGYSNQSSQIRASFSHDDRYIIRFAIDRFFLQNATFVYLVEVKTVGFISGELNQMIHQQIQS